VSINLFFFSFFFISSKRPSPFVVVPGSPLNFFFARRVFLARLFSQTSPGPTSASSAPNALLATQPSARTPHAREVNAPSLFSARLSRCHARAPAPEYFVARDTHPTHHAGDGMVNKGRGVCEPPRRGAALGGAPPRSHPSFPRGEGGADQERHNQRYLTNTPCKHLDRALRRSRSTNPFILSKDSVSRTSPFCPRGDARGAAPAKRLSSGNCAANHV